MTQLNSYLPFLIALSQQISKKILTLYHQTQPLAIQEKIDHTPLTAADLISHQLLIEGLSQLTPTIPIISEESSASILSARKAWPTCWLIDPLDGTKEFINKTDDFTINIALIENHEPVLGFIYIPVTGVCYYAIKDGASTKRLANGQELMIKTRPLNLQQSIVIASRRHADNPMVQAFFASLPGSQRLSRGSALKFCLIAEGLADVYPRFGDTSEWDTAAGQCILIAAGGAVIDTQGQPLRYNMRSTLLNPHFIAVGDNEDFWRSYIARL